MDASHTFKVRAVAGATPGPDTTYTWTIDRSAPTITNKPANPSPDASFSFNHTQAAYGFECKLDADSFQTCNSPKNYLDAPAIADGSHTFTVQAVDADNVATQSTTPYTWLLDTINPQTNASGADNNWHNTAQTVHLAASDPGFSANPKTGSGVQTLHYNVDGGTQTNVPGLQRRREHQRSDPRAPRRLQRRRPHDHLLVD